MPTNRGLSGLRLAPASLQIALRAAANAWNVIGLGEGEAVGPGGGTGRSGARDPAAIAPIPASAARTTTAATTTKRFMVGNLHGRRIAGRCGIEGNAARTVSMTA